MKIAIACCAILMGLSAGSAIGAPLRDSASWFTDRAPRPPRAVPHARPHYSAAAPVPRAKPQAESAPDVTGSVPAPARGPTFPPVAPLE